MKITTLGIWGAYPEAESANSSFLLQQDNFNLLLDCGSGVLSQLQRYIALTQLDALILSHYHNDHFVDVGALQYAMRIQLGLGLREEPFPIYGQLQDAEAHETLNYREYTKAHAIKPEEAISLGPWEVSFCPTSHPVYCLAMKFVAQGRKLVYITDTEWVDGLVDFAQAVDLIICEASLYNEQLGKIKGHLTAGQAGELAARAKAKQLILTHFPHFGDLNQLAAQAQEVFPYTVHLAHSGLTVKI